MQLVLCASNVHKVLTYIVSLPAKQKTPKYDIAEQVPGVQGCDIDGRMLLLQPPH